MIGTWLIVVNLLLFPCSCPLAIPLSSLGAGEELRVLLHRLRDLRLEDRDDGWDAFGTLREKLDEQVGEREGEDERRRIGGNTLFYTRGTVGICGRSIRP